MSREIDCIIVGHNERDFEEICNEAKKLERISGNYRHIKANTMFYQGKGFHIWII